MLTFADGAKTVDGANNAVDIAAQSVTAQVNGTSFDMSNHDGVWITGICNAVTGTGTGTVFLQESNESAANFTNVSGASVTFNTANTQKCVYAHWTNDPLRLKYGRVCALNATNAITLVAASIRVGAKSGSTNTDSNVTQVNR